MCHFDKIMIYFKFLLPFIKKYFTEYFSHYHITYVTGYFNFTADDARGTWELIGHVINDTWTIEHFRVAPSIKNLKINFDSLFEQNKDFGKY